MPLQQFQQDDSPRAQRMTADEAKFVIDLWQQEQAEQTGLTDKPAVPDVAEGLDISITDVQHLLADVRARREAEEAQLAQEQELSEIRLAEEERKLAEVRRQRAELRREQAEVERGRERTQGQKYARPRPQESEPATTFWSVESDAIPWEEAKRLMDEEMEPLPGSLDTNQIRERIQEHSNAKAYSFGSHVRSLFFVLMCWGIAIALVLFLWTRH